MKRSSDSDPTLVSERRDNETCCSAHVLIAVVKESLNLANHALLLCLTFDFFVSITQLLLPVEVVCARYVVSFELINNGTRVDILCDERRQLRSFQISEVTSHQISQKCELLFVLRVPLIERVWLIKHLVNSIFSLKAPLNHVNSEYNLSWFLENPLLLGLSLTRVALVTFFEATSECLSHVILNFVKPVLNFVLMLDSSFELDLFAFSRDHGR